MTEFFQLLKAIWQAVEPYKEVVTLMSLAFGFWKWMDNRLKREKAFAIATADALVIAEARIKELEGDVAALERFDPACWLEDASRAGQANRLERLRTLVTERSPALHSAFAELAKLELESVSAGPDAGDGLREAVRLATIANQLSPGSTLAMETSVEATSALAMLDTRHGSVPEDAVFGSMDQRTAELLLTQLNKSAYASLDKNDLLIGEQLAQRSNVVAARFFGEHSLQKLHADRLLADASYRCGKYQDALEAIQRCVDSAPNHLADDDLSFLAHRYFRALILGELGRAREALADFAQVVPMRDRASPRIDQDLYNNHLLLARLLESARQLTACRREIAWLDRNATEAAPDLQSIASASQLKARLLEVAGKLPDAISESIRPLEQVEASLGRHHPAAIGIRTNVARLRARNGELDAALSEITSVLSQLTGQHWLGHGLRKRAERVHSEIVNAMNGPPGTPFIDIEAPTGGADQYT